MVSSNNEVGEGKKGKKRNPERGEMLRAMSHFNIEDFYSIAQALSALILAVTVRFSKQKRDLEKILTFIYITQTL